MAYPQLLERKANRKAYKNMSLYSLTQDLHHVCEDHPVGASMSRGDVDEQWWADWVHALLLAHEVIDPEVAEPLRASEKLEMDLEMSRYQPRANPSAEAFAEALQSNPHLREAAVYVLTGAHLMGGQVMRKTIGDRLPTKHLQLADRKAMAEIWSPIRERVDIAEEARAVFRWLLDIMETIYQAPAAGGAA